MGFERGVGQQERRDEKVLYWLSPPELFLDYILDTDASNVGIGAMLSQLVDGQEKVIA